MPAYYDIYGISLKRDKETIESFLDYFSDREKIEDRAEQEIYVMENDKYKVQEELIPIKTLTEVIEYGIAHPNKGFSFYIGDHLKNVNHIILQFTYDGKMVFGISVEEKIRKNDVLINNIGKVKEVETLIKELTSAHKTSIQFEYPPAIDEAEFDEGVEMWKDLNQTI